MTSPWRALADFIYTRRKCWNNFMELDEDLRIDRDMFVNSDKAILNLLIKQYPSYYVRKCLKKLLKDL